MTAVSGGGIGGCTGNVGRPGYGQFVVDGVVPEFGPSGRRLTAGSPSLSVSGAGGLQRHRYRGRIELSGSCVALHRRQLGVSTASPVVDGRCRRRCSRTIAHGDSKPSIPSAEVAMVKALFDDCSRGSPSTSLSVSATAAAADNDGDGFGQVCRRSLVALLGPLQDWG